MAAAAGAVVGGIASMIGSDKQADAATAAAEAQARAARQSTAASVAAQERMFEKQVELQEPWRQSGIRHLGELERQVGAGQLSYTPRDFEFETDPGYEFRKQEGMKAIQNMLAARGVGAQSGPLQKAMARYAQDYASGEYQNAFSRHVQQEQIRKASKELAFNQLAALSRTGQTAAQSISALGGQAAGAMSQSYMSGGLAAGKALGGGIAAAGAARSSGYKGVAGAMQQGYENYLSQQMMDRYLGSGGGSTSLADTGQSNIGQADTADAGWNFRGTY